MMSSWWWSHISSFPWNSPWPQNRLRTSLSIEGNKNYKSIRAPQYQYARERYERAVDTIPYHVQPNSTRNISIVYTYTRTKKVLIRAKREKEQQGKRKEKKENKRKSWKQKQACAQGTRDKVAVCWYDQSCPVDGPTEGRRKKTRRKNIHVEGWDRAKKQNKTSRPMSS